MLFKKKNQSEGNWGVEIDPGINFPQSPPLEAHPNGDVIELEPGAAQDINIGRVQRLGIWDDGQRYLLRPSDLEQLLKLVTQKKNDKVQRFLESKALDNETSQAINRFLEDQVNLEGQKEDRPGAGSPKRVELHKESEDLDEKLERVQFEKRSNDPSWPSAN